jgi:pimeloyl-ACP methyl ester carboxylesterase
MPFFQNGEVRIHYEVSGSGYPVLMLAPGGMRSTIDFWNRMPFNPVVDLASDFQVVAMDQRNAGESIAPISASDGWEAYAGDQLALMDHLGHRRFHAVGCCIGCSFILKLAELAPQRITAGGIAAYRLQPRRAKFVF